MGNSGWGVAAMGDAGLHRRRIKEVGLAPRETEREWVRGLSYSRRMGSKSYMRRREGEEERMIGGGEQGRRRGGGDEERKRENDRGRKGEEMSRWR